MKTQRQKQQNVVRVMRWRDKCPERHSKNLERSRIRYAAFKESIFNLLGKECKRCGFDDKRALQIDHVNGDGSKERKANCSSEMYYKKILADPKFIEKYQILCANCNWIKRVENKEYTLKAATN